MLSSAVRLYGATGVTFEADSWAGSGCEGSVGLTEGGMAQPEHWLVAVLQLELRTGRTRGDLLGGVFLELTGAAGGGLLTGCSGSAFHSSSNDRQRSACSVLTIQLCIRCWEGA